TALANGTAGAVPLGEEGVLVVRPRNPQEPVKRMEVAVIDPQSGKATVQTDLGLTFDMRSVSLSPSGALIACDAPNNGAFDFTITDWRSGKTLSRFSTAA